MQKESRARARVVATGGLASVIAPECSFIDEVDEFLTLDGLRIIHQRNSVQDVKKRLQQNR
jgi:type III pantothenate kinase